MPKPSPWNEKTDKRLIELAAAGYSAKVIGERIGVSRNSALGRAMRLRSKGVDVQIGDPLCPYTYRGKKNAKGTGKDKRSASDKWNQWKAKRAANGNPVVTIRSKKAILRAEAREMSHGGIVCCESPKLIWDLDWFDCRWIVTIDEPVSDTYYCGNIKSPGCNYCAAHQAMATDNRVPGVYVPLQKFNTSWRAA